MIKYLKKKYIFRIDDITPGMNWNNFEKIEKIFDKFGIKPIIGVVPDNQDQKLDKFEKINDFWGKIRSLQKKGWVIAQHGYQHKYCTENSGIIGLNNYSEFAGLKYEEQFEKIKKGKDILEKNISEKIKWWMAPAHSFDKTTCKVLKNLNFKYITDGIALFPFKEHGLKWLPQQIWRPWKYPYGLFFGTWIICFHINNEKEDFFINLEKFLEKNGEKVIGVDDVEYGKKGILDLLFRGYFWGLIFLFKK